MLAAQGSITFFSHLMLLTLSYLLPLACIYADTLLLRNVKHGLQLDYKSPVILAHVISEVLLQQVD